MKYKVGDVIRIPDGSLFKIEEIINDGYRYSIRDSDKTWYKYVSFIPFEHFEEDNDIVLSTLEKVLYDVE